MATITKKEMINRIADSSAERRLQVKDIIEQFLEEIVADLCKGNRLEFRGFGVFEIRSRPARRAQNPRTGIPVDVTERRHVKFKPGRDLKRKLELHIYGDGDAEVGEKAELPGSQDATEQN